MVRTIIGPIITRTKMLQHISALMTAARGAETRHWGQLMMGIQRCYYVVIRMTGRSSETDATNQITRASRKKLDLYIVPSRRTSDQPSLQVSHPELEILAQLDTRVVYTHR
jgi:hypothetical protein